MHTGSSISGSTALHATSLVRSIPGSSAIGIWPIPDRNEEGRQQRHRRVPRIRTTSRLAAEEEIETEGVSLWPRGRPLCIGRDQSRQVASKSPRRVMRNCFRGIAIIAGWEYHSRLHYHADTSHSHCINPTVGVASFWTNLIMTLAASPAQEGDQ